MYWRLFVSGFAIKDTADIDVRLTINGEVRQNSNSRNALPIVPLIQHAGRTICLAAG